MWEGLACEAIRVYDVSVNLSLSLSVCVSVKGWMDGLLVDERRQAEKWADARSGCSFLRVGHMH